MHPCPKKGHWREKCQQMERFCLFRGVNHVKKHIQPKWKVIITATIKDVPVNAVETYRRVKISHLTSALDAAEWAASRTGRFTLSEYPHKAGWVVEPDWTFGRKNLMPCRESKSGSYTHINTSPCYYIMYHEINILTLLKLLTTVFTLCLTVSYSLHFTFTLSFS